MQELDIQTPHDIVDLGCASGLSSLELKRCFPHSTILGLDLSPYFLSVARVLQQERCRVISSENDVRMLAGSRLNLLY